MGGILRQGTAAHILFGPFVDKTDGVTLEVGAGIITSIDHAATGIFLSKNGAAGAIRHQAVTASVLDAYGMFQVHLDTTDTDTVGRLRVMMAEAATFLPVWDDFLVLPANVYDALTGADLLDVSMAQCNGGAVPSGAIPNAVAGAAGGVFIAGTNAATTITSAGGSALTLSSTGANGAGLVMTGNGSGAGMTSTGGATGPGILGTGGGNHADADGARFVAGGALASGIKTDRLNLSGAATITGGIAANITGNLSGTTGGHAVGVDLTAVEKTSVTQQTGYQLGAVWFDTAGAAGAVSYVNGIVTNPCSSPANTHTLLGNLNLKVIRVVNASSYTLEAGYTGYSFIGEKWTLALNGVLISNCYFEGATVSGTSTGTGNQFTECQIGTVTLLAGATQASACTMRFCGLNGTFTIGAAGIYTFEGCYNETAAAGVWILDFAAVGATTIRLAGFSGSVEIRNMAAGDVIAIEGGGAVTLAATCAAGTVYIRGNFELTNASAITPTDTSRWNEDQVLAAVTGAVGSVTGAVGSVTGAVGSVTGNVGGSVASVVGAVGSVTGAVGSVTGNVGGSVASVVGAVGSVTGNVGGSVASVTGDVGGNVVGSVASVTGAVGSVTGAVGSVTGNVGGSVASVTALGVQAKADVNAEVVDALSVDTIPELAAAIPAATPTPYEAMMLPYMALRNKLTTTATAKTLFNDAGAAIAHKDLSDDAVTYTEAEMQAGA